jgi:amino acid transporter
MFILSFSINMAQLAQLKNMETVGEVFCMSGSQVGFWDYLFLEQWLIIIGGIVSMLLIFFGLTRITIGRIRKKKNSPDEAHPIIKKNKNWGRIILIIGAVIFLTSLIGAIVGTLSQPRIDAPSEWCASRNECITVGESCP